MSVIIDRSFLLRITPILKKFSRKKEDLYNFRCPICGDSHKNPNKCRGFIYRKENAYFYRCHNCGATLNFYGFLESVAPSILKEYSFEKFKEKNPDYKKQEEEDIPEEVKVKPKFKKSLKLKTVYELPENHLARKYCTDRKIPEDALKTLYYAPDFKGFVEGMGWDKKGLVEADRRLVIPFYDEDKNLIALQGRTLTDSKMRYITVKVSETDRKFFGLDRIDKEKNVCVVEGPIDSLFLDNAIATADSNLQAAENIFEKDKLILIFDNEPRNKEIVKLMNKAIENHFRVVIWPEMIDKKDINDMILDGFDPEDIQDIIEKNTFVNLRAKMEFINWKKV